jgi:hypothetical protein
MSEGQNNTIQAIAKKRSPVARAIMASVAIVALVSVCWAIDRFRGIDRGAFTYIEGPLVGLSAALISLVADSYFKTSPWPARIAKRIRRFVWSLGVYSPEDNDPRP